MFCHTESIRTESIRTESIRTESIHTECGIFGIISCIKTNTLFNKTIDSLYELQHRGQESCGIAYLNKDLNNYWKYHDYVYHDLHIFKNLGLVKNVFKEFDSNSITINSIIGHVRYSTSGKSKQDDNSKISEAHPIPGIHPILGEFAIVHNGNIPNLKSDTSDTIYIKNFLENSIEIKTWDDILINLVNTIPGTYCLLILTLDGTYAVRDKIGIRPISIGKNKTSYCFSSETVAMDNYDFIRNINAGEIISIKNIITPNIKDKTISNNLKFNIVLPGVKQEQHCIFETIYFMNPNSLFYEDTVYNHRMRSGKILANNDTQFIKENKLTIENTIVVGCPYTGIASGEGYAEESKLPYKQIINKRKNANRTFIMPSDDIRIQKLKNKFSFDENMIKDKHIIFVDDSIVRGNTLRCLCKIFRNYGCLSFNARIASPPVINPCFYGIDVPTQKELIANEKTIEEIRILLNIDSLDYLTLNELYEAYGKDETNFCNACFDGNYIDELTNW